MAEELASFMVKDSYNSFTVSAPVFEYFERELHEDTGIIPLNHPNLKPVRKIREDNFFQMTGDAVHEVAVGPIHAGVIEPGHFRFMCHGEKVYDLEIMLGYQHRGVENLFTKQVGSTPKSTSKINISSTYYQMLLKINYNRIKR